MVCKYQIYHDEETNNWWLINFDYEAKTLDRFNATAFVYKIEKPEGVVNLQPSSEYSSSVPVSGFSGLRFKTVKSITNQESEVI
ncbi:hypothetical protein HLA87_02550 [Mycoplasma miroungigenitalium]|uniref:Uncharacterized protein n=1 Tax=Mycoplasma miroungigenitalium TaxID=754515 RepID=A0A6M4J9H4_9MOLU|nr:hypothetical protein [Mycoplasma miroungigenitalium]QJR43654.1 hypothetical protein HLA87_02550 [Mycoplasma miroungigenitalium]